MLATYRQLRRALYLASFLLPLVLGVFGGDQKGSISAYYDEADWKRDVFVGTLCAVGFGILSYKGFKPRENLALNLSGVMAFRGRQAAVRLGTAGEGTALRLCVCVPFGHYVRVYLPCKGYSPPHR